MLKLSIFRFKVLFSLAVFFFFGGITVALWQNQNSHKRELIFQHTETSAEQIRIRVESMMCARMASLELLSHRWVERTPSDFSKKRFLQLAKAFYTHYPGFFAIRWIDPDGIIRWGFPEEKTRVQGAKIPIIIKIPVTGTHLRKPEENSILLLPPVLRFMGAESVSKHSGPWSMPARCKVT
jgi:hypothetical protein